MILEATRTIDPDLARFLHVAASSGARRGELCALRWRNIDTTAQTLTIERSIIEVPGGLAEKDTKTHANRRIALDPGTLRIFEEQRSDARERARNADMSITDQSFVFSREPDGMIPWTPGGVSQRFKIIRDSIGLNRVRLHDLRHFTATRLMAAGVPVRAVSGRLGHANPLTTLTVYSHWVEATDQTAAAIMGKLLGT
jgi:integrase